MHTNNYPVIKTSTLAILLLMMMHVHHGMAQTGTGNASGDPKSEAPTRRKVATMEELAEALAKRKPAMQAQPEAVKLPPLPEGVTELRFDEFYKMPVGPRGLEPTEKLLSLNGKRVRILGHMANMRLRNNRQMLLAPLALQAQPLEYGQADDIPATHVLVRVPGNVTEPVPFTPGLLLLTGTLTVGGKALDRETAFVRLLVDAPQPTPANPAAGKTPQ